MTSLEAITVMQPRDVPGGTNGNMNLAELKEHPNNILNVIAIFKVKKPHF